MRNQAVSRAVWGGVVCGGVGGHHNDEGRLLRFSGWRPECLGLHSTVQRKEEMSCVLLDARISGWILIWAQSLGLLKLTLRVSFVIQWFFSPHRVLAPTHTSALWFYYAAIWKVERLLIFCFWILTSSCPVSASIYILHSVFCVVIYMVKQIVIQISFPFLFQIGHHINILEVLSIVK